MDKNKQLIAIAEEVDPTSYPPGTGVVIKDEPTWIVRLGRSEHPITCPNYLRCHNAMANALATRTHEEMWEFSCELRKVLSLNIDHTPASLSAKLLRATPAQKAEAFLKTFDLWKEDRE